jgi:hypothetical protein
LDFWQVHGWLFLIAATFIPRLTMLFAVSVPFGLLHWLGWAFAPHLTVAILATTYFWDTNPLLCIVAWFIALGGSFGEGKAASVWIPGRRRRGRRAED